MLARIIDALPQRLWRPLNMYFGGRLHFCVRDNVRTVEWNNRVLGSGEREFPHAWYDEEMAKLERGSPDEA